MKLCCWRLDGSTLTPVAHKDVSQYAKSGLYVCCKNHHQNEDGEPMVTDCGMHLWVYANSGEVPPYHEIIKAIKKEVPHINGKGAHQD